MKIKIALLVMVLLFASVSFSEVYAALGTKKLPTRWTYASEWISAHLLTWKNETKVLKFDSYATKRAQDIETAYSLGKTDQIAKLSSRYGALKSAADKILNQKKLQNKKTLVETVKSNTIEQQKVLSKVRQNVKDEDQKKTIVAVQEESVNQVSNTISTVEGKKTADNFVNQIVAVWRDPNSSVEEEKATRVYAAGTQIAGNNGSNGVIIDGGKAKVSQNSEGKLKIEYAPGTGPSSVTTGEGKKIWKIQMSNGTIVESYSAASWVVVGQTGQTASNIVVNTVTGSTNGLANVVVGNSGGSAGVKVEGGLPSVVGNSGGSGVVKVEGGKP